MTGRYHGPGASGTVMAAAAHPDLTKNQEAVLAALRAAGRPLSAYQIMDQTTAAGVRAPQQIYRALDRLIDYRLVHRIETLNAYLFCDHGPHAEEVAFAICRRCGAVVEIAMKGIMPGLERSAAGRGFTVEEAHIELSGLCADCREAEADVSGRG
jgi:Fur family zinc uptake transcriptional regulator